MPKKTAKNLPNNQRRNKDEKKPDRPLLLKIDGSVYGKVTAVLGYCNFSVLCFDDGKVRHCVLRSSIKKKSKIFLYDVVLVGTRDFDNDEKGDIIYKYMPNEIEQLKKKEEIPKNISLEDEEFGADITEDDIPFDFESI